MLKQIHINGNQYFKVIRIDKMRNALRDTKTVAKRKSIGRYQYNTYEERASVMMRKWRTTMATAGNSIASIDINYSELIKWQAADERFSRYTTMRVVDLCMAKYYQNLQEQCQNKSSAPANCIVHKMGKCLSAFLLWSGWARFTCASSAARHKWFDMACQAMKIW